MFKLHVSVVLNWEGRVLLLQEADEDYGLWNLPGGHIEATETVQEAAVREAFEETGLSVTLDALLGVFTGKSGRARTSVRFVFAATILENSGAEKPGDDILSLRWFSPEEVAALDDSALVSPYCLRRILTNEANGARYPLDFIVEA